MFEPVIIGNATLYLGDCLEILPTLKQVDAVITDPPYGIGEAAGKNASRGKLAKVTPFDSDDWDDKPLDRDTINYIKNLGIEVIIFGGNYYYLPPTSCWLVWDKVNGKSDFADCEMAWTNINGAVRLKRYQWAGMLQENMKNKEVRVHPTQKPIPVMEWALTQCKKAPQTIADPFMGSGTTGVACMNLGRKFIGIEIEPKYFEIACERIEQAQKQGRLFA